MQFILNEFYVFITNLSPTKENGGLLFFPHYFGIGTAGTLLTFPLTAVLLIKPNKGLFLNCCKVKPI